MEIYIGYGVKIIGICENKMGIEMEREIKGRRGIRKETERYIGKTCKREKEIEKTAKITEIAKIKKTGKVRKKRLAIILENLEGFKRPKVKLEQYTTPPSLAAEIVVRCLEDINEDDLIVDLGCGTGIFSVAFELVGYKAVGFDIDSEALRIARRNSKKFGVNPDFVIQKVEDVCLKSSQIKRCVVVMNPPFGIKKKHADRPFLKKALEIGKLIYTIHSAGSEQFIKRFCENAGFSVTHIWRYLIPLRRTYSFHEKEFKRIAVEVYRISCRKDKKPECYRGN